MSRYFSAKRPSTAIKPNKPGGSFPSSVRPRAWVEDEDAWGATSPVGVPDAWENEAVDTSLLDAEGDCIMRAANPVGFGRDDEW